jgi:hypothetical protein
LDLTEVSETSAKHNLTPGKYQKEHIKYSKHGESLRSRNDIIRLKIHLPYLTVDFLIAYLVTDQNKRLKLAPP